jgi:hypothetical protein
MKNHTLTGLISATLLLLILTLSSCSAVELYHQKQSDLEFGVTSNNATQCIMIAINSPNQEIFINQSGTRQSQTFNFSIAAGNYTELGVYCHNIECFDGVETKSGDVCYTVNYLGKELKQSQSTLYLGLLAIMVFILFATFFGMGFLPHSNIRDEEGRIMQINHLKYLRTPLWLFAYFVFVGIVYISSNIALAFLVEEMIGRILLTIYIILLGLAPVVIIVLMLSFFVKFYHDKEFQKMINRGILPGGHL